MSDRDTHEWSAEEIRRLGTRVVDMIAGHLAEMRQRPAFRPAPAELANAFATAPAPTEGTAPDAILEEFRRTIEPYPFGNGHPRFFGWVNSPPAVLGVFGEALAAAMDPSCAGGNHAAIHVERQVVRWFREALGFPEETMGLLVSGGTAAGLTALAVARHVRAGWDVREEGLDQTRRPLVVYRGREAHSCYQKVVELLGIGSRHLRSVEVDGRLRMRPEALDDAIRADLRAGRTPVAVVASAGSVNTGAIDPLNEIADVCREHGVWLHVDGAYGAPAVLGQRYREAFAGMERADSLALDPHKWLYVPVEAGLVLVRDGAAMRSAFSLVPPYLRTDDDPHGVGGPPWFSEFGLQQTRGFRALKVWMCLKHVGLEGYGRSIDRDIALAERLAERVRREARLEILEPQSLSIVCFRRKYDGDVDALNRELLRAIQLSGRAFLSGTVIDGVFWLRACFVNPRTRDEDVDALVEAVLETEVPAAGPTTQA